MADEAIGYMKELNAAAPDKPFFLYYVPGGSHSSHQPKAEWVEKFKGKFDMGWNALRDQIFANQKRLGVVPDNAKLTDWPDSLPKWETLSADQKKLFARQAEVYAGYTAYTDYEIGRVIQAVEDMGQLDNTLIIYIDGDNGTSPEGTLSGYAQPVHLVQRHPRLPDRRATQVLRCLGLGGELQAGRHPDAYRPSPNLFIWQFRRRSADAAVDRSRQRRALRGPRASHRRRARMGLRPQLLHWPPRQGSRRGKSQQLDTGKHER
jgi:arylsulfatase A-like enzyme